MSLAVLPCQDSTMMKRLIFIAFALCLSSLSQARIARFYFDKVYLASGTADKYDTPVPGIYIITFNTTEKTISVYYKADGYQPYRFTTKYKSVKEYHGKSENTDYYTLAGLLYDKDTYTIANTYDKTTRTYGVSFTTTHFLDGDMFSREFLGYFGAPSDWRCWPEVFFENPYKHESISDSGKKRTSRRTL